MKNEGEIAPILREGGVGVLPTDTLYGVVGSALLPETVGRIYELKGRNSDKPLIVLISRIDEVEQFGVVLSEKLIARLKTYWPGPYSLILPTIDEEYSYLHRGTGAIAFRLPDKEELINLLGETGPLVAPSANTEGRPPARTIAEARRYFGTDVDFYVDGGELTGKPSTLVDLSDGDPQILRP